MVMSLARVRLGDRRGMQKYLLATLLLGSVFLGIQVFEYRELMVNHVHPVGVSSNGHFLPGSSLFASCFFTMTGFHGAHVAGGLVTLSVLLISTAFGRITAQDHATLELAGLYWHFVDLVWIILFTVVYLI
jgi:heme/copper-type cytochrome/quinol oxidase subunit 3